MSDNQSGGFCLTLSFCCLTSLPLISALVLCLSISESLGERAPAAAVPSDVAESSRRAGGVGVAVSGGHSSW